MGASYRTADATAPAFNAAEVDPDNTLEFEASRMIYVGTQGDIFVDMAGIGVNVPIRNVVGALPIQVTRIYQTGTTATNILRFW